MVMIFLALLGAPLIEIGVFIEVGGRIGLWATLVLIVGTAIAGAVLLRHQGLSTLARARETLARGGLPVQEVADGVCLLIAGALLVTPGFVTDAAGGLLLFPPARLLAQRWAFRRMIASGRSTVHGYRYEPRGTRANRSMIDADYTEIDDNGEKPPTPENKPRGR